MSEGGKKTKKQQKTLNLFWEKTPGNVNPGEKIKDLLTKKQNVFFYLLL